MIISETQLQDRSTDALCLNPTHLKEWVEGSGVSEAIARLNIQSLSAEEMNLFVYDQRKPKKPIQTGGWRCGGVQWRTGLPMGDRFGQVKPDKPHDRGEGKKSAKYMTAAGMEPDAIFLAMPGDKYYWRNVYEDKSQPILIPEGAKKAAAGMSLGYACIAVTGVNNGVKDGVLVPELAQFAQPGREFILPFDSDYQEKPQCRAAIKQLGARLDEKGCKVRVPVWDKKYKGMDDFIVANGEDAFKQVIANALPLDEWEKQFAKPQESKSQLSLRDRVLEILNQHQDCSRRDEAFINLALITSTSVREIKDLAASIESEVDLEESRSDRRAEVEKLLTIGKYQLELGEYLDSSVARPLERVAGWMGTTPAVMLTTLYPVIGSLLPVGTQLELIKATDFYALPVVYSGVVCESGGGKSPAQKTVIKPLFSLQDEAEADYKERLLEYQRELAGWKKDKDTDEPAPEQPTPREYYTTDATSEAIALIQSQQPKSGFLGWFDELPALFKSQGQYKNGRGADGEKILSGRDGTGFKVNRASGKRLVVSQSAYSIVGSLQPAILRQMMGDFTDANGQWARFLWTVMQIQPAPYPDNAIPFDISGLLKGIYRRLSKLTPQTYELSPKAQKLYRDWYNELDRFKVSESRQGLRAVYSKMKGDTGVLALLLHCFNGCVHEGSTPELDVSEQTMAAAIKLAQYHIGQVKLIHSEGDAANGDIAAIHAKIIQLSERKGWLRAADVRDIDRQTKKQFSASDIRRHFRELEESGFGQTKGEGPRLAWSIYRGDPDSGQTQGRILELRTNSGQTQDNPKNAVSALNHGIQPLAINNSGQLRTNSGQTQDTLKNATSAFNLDVQQSPVKTQDTQDSFAATRTTLVDAQTSGNEIKDVALNFDVLSCPEFASESHNSITMGIPAQDKTQDTCPESVLSCPENVLSCPMVSPKEPAKPVTDLRPGDAFRYKGGYKGYKKYLGKVLTVKEVTRSQSFVTVWANETDDSFPCDDRNIERVTGEIQPYLG